MERARASLAQGPLGQSGSRAIGQREPVGADFRQMALWQESQGFAEEVARYVAGLARNRASDPIGSQLVRSAGSIAANIAEGYGRFSQAAYRNHLSIARGSAFESESWIDLLMRLGYIEREDGDDLTSKCKAIQIMLTTRMKSLPAPEQPAVRTPRGAS
jgi:four helix bundle protein